jgi:hypothetical protein
MATSNLNPKIGVVCALLMISLNQHAQTMTEILGRPTDKSITINVLFDTVVETYFEYGTTKGTYASSTTIVKSETGVPVEVQLTGLTAETRYYYRTRYRKLGDVTFLASDMHTFITQRKPGSSFVFTVEADPHPYDKKGCAELWHIALQNQLNDGADFMLDLGDTFGDDHFPTTITTDQVKQLQLNCRDFFGLVCHSMPLFFCIGNHEGESGYYLTQTPPNNLAMYETTWRKLYYPNPIPDDFYSGDDVIELNGVGKAENYYAWQWGDALFVVLDMYRYATKSEKPQRWDFTIGKTQYDWFKNTLQGSNAKYKFVFSHHVMGQGRGGIELANSYEWGGQDGSKGYVFDTYRPGWGLPLHQLMKANNVTAFFQGHDHIFVHQQLDSIIYQSVPMPSDSTYKIGVTDNGDAYLSGHQLPGSGHIRVTVSADSAKFDYVSAVLPKDENDSAKNAKVVYSYSVKPKVVKSALEQPKDDQNTCYMYPNPTRDAVNIRFSQACEKPVSVMVQSIDGKLANNIQRDNQADGEIIKIDHLQKGWYVISVKMSDQTLISKKVIVH